MSENQVKVPETSYDCIYVEISQRNYKRFLLKKDLPVLAS